jgi:hypothetical protein
MSTRFQEFLREKAKGSELGSRNRSRAEWLGALNRLFEQVRDWLRQSDPDDLLEILPYEVERVEERLGIYDAPALKIRLGTDSVDILPVGRHVAKPLAIQHLQAIAGNERRWGDLSGGRVDVTDGERRYQLLRSIEDGEDRWYAWSDKPPLTPLDRDCLEAILQDLLR